MISLSLFDIAFLAQASVAPIAKIQDNFESYFIADLLNGQNGGTGWNGSWVSRNGHLGLVCQDDFQSYPQAGLNNRNGGSGWAGVWKSRSPNL